MLRCIRTDSCWMKISKLWISWWHFAGNTAPDVLQFWTRHSTSSSTKKKNKNRQRRLVRFYTLNLISYNLFRCFKLFQLLESKWFSLFRNFDMFFSHFLFVRKKKTKIVFVKKKKKTIIVFNPTLSNTFCCTDLIHFHVNFDLLLLFLWYFNHKYVFAFNENTNCVNFSLQLPQLFASSC